MNNKISKTESSFNVLEVVTNKNPFLNALNTKEVLKGAKNYKSLVQDIDMVLDIHDLCNYVYINKNKKLNISKSMEK